LRALRPSSDVVRFKSEIPAAPQLAEIITSSLFIGFEHMSNDWKVEKVNYEFGIESSLRLYLD
jgi:hypothetical protein